MLFLQILDKPGLKNEKPRKFIISYRMSNNNHQSESRVGDLLLIDCVWKAKNVKILNIWNFVRILRVFFERWNIDDLIISQFCTRQVNKRNIWLPVFHSVGSIRSFGYVSRTTINLLISDKGLVNISTGSPHGTNFRDLKKIPIIV